MYNCCHFPQGKCGLKYPVQGNADFLPWSLPSGEVWIEILLSVICSTHPSRHFPQGKCGLKCLKSNHLPTIQIVTSLRGSVDWNTDKPTHKMPLNSHFPQGKCGLKYVWKLSGKFYRWSLPSGEVWIEIFVIGIPMGMNVVTSLRGSVDWNRIRWNLWRP